MLLIQLVINGLVYGILFALMAIGFGIVYRTTLIFHLAYGSFYLVSAYTLYYLVIQLGTPQIVGALGAVTVTIWLGIVIEKAVYRLFNKKSAGLGATLIASLGVYIVIENFLALIFGNDVKVISFKAYPTYRLLLFKLTSLQIIQLIVGLFLIIMFYILISNTKLFKTLWAMGDEPELIQVLGLPYEKLRILVFILSSFFISVAAILFSIDVGVDLHTGFTFFLIASVSVFIGGIDSIWGWIIGALILSEIQSIALWKFSSKWNDLITFSLLIVILLLKPHGILAIKKRIEEI